MHLHEFLAEVHKIVKPRVYLEIGVQHGTSLALAHGAEHAFGVDPEPLRGAVGNETIYPMTSDAYFETIADLRLPSLDLGFIDGLHLAEQAFRDFENMTNFTHSRSVIVIDDVLPRNQGEANRIQCPGDWTGDVWKVTHMILKSHQELTVLEVDTQPTGTLVVFGFDQFSHLEWPDLSQIMSMESVPDTVINRDHAIGPLLALHLIEKHLKETV